MDHRCEVVFDHICKESALAGQQGISMDGTGCIKQNKPGGGKNIAEIEYLLYEYARMVMQLVNICTLNKLSE